MSIYNAKEHLADECAHVMLTALKEHGGSYFTPDEYHKRFAELQLLIASWISV